MEDLFALVCERGLIVRGSTTEVTGSMAAVIGDMSKLKVETPGVEVANHNSNKQSVLSGSCADIAKEIEVQKARGFKVIQLKVDTAFHSKYMNDKSAAFKKGIDAAPIGALK